ncbi:hypothetical protein V8G54_020058 [Vigna mungo]|uniref:Uncharacterized protein n=1 Tax=Vigna mungo TaxID=3915 RepID=A0AAQ3NCY9_VIGMU
MSLKIYLTLQKPLWPIFFWVFPSFRVPLNAPPVHIHYCLCFYFIPIYAETSNGFSWYQWCWCIKPKCLFYHCLQIFKLFNILFLYQLLVATRISNFFLGFRHCSWVLHQSGHHPHGCGCSCVSPSHKYVL